VLDEAAIEAVVHSLQPYPYGWRHGLPASYCFLGQPLAVTIETRPFPADFLAPRPTETELDLVRLILGGLSAVLVIAEREYATYNASDPELLPKVHEPRVWVCREFQASDGPDRWALTSAISDAPDWTIFVEFRGLTFVEIWSGD
jgi:hypothetical protein